MTKNRPSFREIYMRMARLVSQRSTCRRLNVGCVIASVDNRKVVAVGYNGNATGLPNDCDSHEPGKCGCLHAEMNAVINCDSPRELQKVIYTTNLPCSVCAKFIVNLGNVVGVYYEQDYRLRDGEEILRTAGIPCVQFTPRADSAFADLLSALGWQGGTIHQMIAEVKRLAENEKAGREITKPGVDR